MELNKLTNKRTIDLGYDTNMLNNLASCANITIKQYKDALETIKEPLKMIRSVMKSMGPALKVANDIKELKPPELHISPFYDDYDFVIPQDNVQKVEIVNLEKISENTLETKTEPMVQSYTLPTNAVWESLYIKFLDGFVVRVEYPGMKSRKFDYKDMGFSNGNTMGPNLKWTLLQEIALNGGALTNAKWDRKFSRNVKYELNEGLKKFFGMKTAPIPHYTKRHGYKTLFTIKPDM